MADDFVRAGRGREVRRLQPASSPSSSRSATAAASRPSTAPAAPSRPSSSASGAPRPIVLMHRIKPLFDPEGLLNPGVLLNPDPDIHIKNLKLMPLADPHRRPLHRVRLLRAGLPRDAPDAVAAPAHRGDPRTRAPAPDRRGPGAARGAGRRLRVCRAQHLRRRQCLRRALPGGHRDRHDGARRTRPPPHRWRAARRRTSSPATPAASRP